MDLTKGDMLIFSGEGEGGTWERYHGKRDKASIRRKLSRERAGGDRWASAWIELDGLEDAGHPGATVYGELGRDLDEIADQRAVPAELITENPAAILRAGKSNPAAAENGRLGGRPRSGAPTSKQISEAFEQIGLGNAKRFGNVYPYIKRGELQAAFGTIMAGSSERTAKQGEFKKALEDILARDALR